VDLAVSQSLRFPVDVISTISPLSTLSVSNLNLFLQTWSGAQPQAAAFIDISYNYGHLDRQLACVTCHIDTRRCTFQPSTTLSPYHILPANQLLFPIPHFFLSYDMSDQSESRSFRLHVLFEAALRDYEHQTGMALTKHPFAEQLQNCNSIESVTAVLCEQTQAFSDFRGRDKIMKPLTNSLSVLYQLSATAGLGQNFGLVRP